MDIRKVIPLHSWKVSHGHLQLLTLLESTVRENTLTNQFFRFSLVIHYSFTTEGKYP